MTVLPTVGNLAWAPVPAISGVEVFDRFNGVPTLGVFSVVGERVLFWRVLGYVPEHFSIWIYVPLDEGAERHLACTDPGDVLMGLVFESPVSRYVTVGIAADYRLIFEREWRLPAQLSSERMDGELLGFLTEALEIALKQDLPQSRRELVHRASRAVRELAAC